MRRQLEIKFQKKTEKLNCPKHQATFTKVEKRDLFYIPYRVHHQFLDVFRSSSCFSECQGQTCHILSYYQRADALPVTRQKSCSRIPAGQ